MADKREEIVLILEKLKEIRDDGRIKEYKTLSDAFATTIESLVKSDQIIYYSISAKVSGELAELSRWKMNTLDKEDTRAFRNLTIAESRMEYGLNLLKESKKN